MYSDIQPAYWRWCRNGHQTSGEREITQKHCAKCGEPFVEKCATCGWVVPSVDREPADLMEGVCYPAGEDERPDYCPECGAPFPWNPDARNRNHSMGKDALTLPDLTDNQSRVLRELIRAHETGKYHSEFQWFSTSEGQRIELFGKEKDVEPFVIEGVGSLDLIAMHNADYVIYEKGGVGGGVGQLLAKALVRDASSVQSAVPPEISDSLQRFRRDHADPQQAAFVMMQFRDTQPHRAIMAGIKEALDPHGISALRADDKEYHPDLYWNVLTYVYGCGLGIAVFERIEGEELNPNVAFEVGYMFALRKPVCLLKDRTLRKLQTDLVGKLYREFDTHDARKSIPERLSQWLADKRDTGLSTP